MFSREKILYWLVLGFAGGVVLNEIFQTTRGKVTALLVIGVALLCIALFSVFKNRQQTKSIIAIVIVPIIIFCALLGGFARGSLTSYFNNRPTELDELVHQKVSLTGVLVEEQEKRDFNTRLTVRVDGVVENDFGAQKGGGAGRYSENVRKIAPQKILLTTGNPKEFHYGDLVRVKGELAVPENFYTETGREFDYVGYLQTSGTKFLIKNASVAVTGHNPPSRAVEWLFLAKRAFVDSIKRMLPEPQSSLAAGILIDGKASINGELQEKFQKTGLVHIVVLSGSNVSIVAEAMTHLFAFLPRVFGIFAAAAGILAFTMITGATSTVVRASIMAILVLLSRLSLRNYDPTRGLFLATFVMLIHNPLILLHSPSFQLSFLATFTVVKVIPFLEFRRWFGSVARFVPERFGLRELVVSNLVVQTFLFPILTWMTGFFSAVSLPTNILVVPLVPLTMLAAFLTALTGFVSRVIALPFAFVAQALLSYELAVVDFFAKFSLAQISFSGFSSGIVAGFYAVVICWFLFFAREGDGGSR